MNSVIALLTILAVATAAPKASISKGLKMRNLFVDPLPTAKVPQGPTTKIIGGDEAIEHSIPYQAFLEVYALSSAWNCGGVLIKPNYVLTAGHCTYEGIEATVILGAHKFGLNEESQQVVVSTKLITHENFDIDNILNDIGLIVLAEAVVLDNFVNVVTLPTGEIQDLVGKTLRVSGWGLTDGFDNALSDVLRVVENPIISNEECANFFGDNVQNYTVCMSGEGGRSACNGDSGGPATVDGVLIGLVSFGVTFCLAEYPSAYTSVPWFSDWIESNTGQ